ncbi:MAG: ABC transporter substrate-binding protein, partial [Anaerolineae bacterium]|nr:ABC transporter substrate-binding protein [Anaerolineae bacterium]
PTATPVPAEPTKAAEPPSKFKESPMLAEMVKAGKLPPVDQRLPENPQVVTPLVNPGVYGGTLRQGIVGNSVTWGGGLYTFQWENLVQWKPDFSDIEPSLAERVEVSPDGREYTFYLRKGVKWSDGQPYTADDVMFYIQDVMYNTDLSPGGPGADWLPGDQKEGFRAEKVDDFTFKLIFPKPYGTLLYQLATWGGRFFAYYPKHYLKQFHAAYNDKVDELAKAEGKENWMQLFFSKATDTWGNPDRFMDVPEFPSLGPWVVTQPLGAGTTARFVRNPYYWKVDEQGNQLPYADEVIITSYQDPQTLTLAALNGDLDFFHGPKEEERELYFDAVNEGKPLKIISRTPASGNTMSIHFNMGSKNPVLREVFQKKDFRIGMSHAINRAEIIEVVFKGQGKPAQVAPLESSPLYIERLANQYLEYDVAKANEHLDKVLPNKDANGMRLGPDGKPFTIIWTLLDQNYGGGDAKAWLQAAELCVGYFKAVGVEVKMDVVSDQVLNERRQTNDIDMFAFHGNEGGAGITAILDPRWHIPGEYWGMFSWGWSPYLTGAQITDEIKANFVEPPPGMKEIRDMWSAATQQTTLEGQVAAMKKVLEKSADEFWCIGISRPGLGYQPMSKRLNGLPDGAVVDWLFGFHKIMRPEQWWIEA